MPFDQSHLKRQLTWTNAIGDHDIRALLRDLQGNVLKPHGRDHVLVSLLRFDSGPVDDARAAARLLGEAATSAREHLDQAALFRQSQVPGNVFIGVALSRAGYEALQIPATQIPPGQAFSAGFRKREEAIGAFDGASGESYLAAGVHALVLLADDNLPRLSDRRIKLLKAIAPGAREVACESWHRLSRSRR